MAGAFVEVDIREAERALGKLASAAGALQPALVEIGEELVKRHKENWHLERNPSDGTPWAPLSPAYRARKPRHKDRILLLDDHLRGELAYQADNRGMLVGTNAEYGATHQYGAKKGSFGVSKKRGQPIPWGDIPPRPFLGISEDDEREITEIIGEHMERALRR